MKRYSKLLIDLVEEILLWLILPFFFFLHNRYEIKNDVKPGQKNVIIVEKWLYKNLLRKRRIDELRAKGINAYGFFDQLQHNSFYESADKLREFIEQKELTNVSLIGISSGGIVSLAYLDRYGWKEIDKFISIGTPFKGTPLMIILSMFSSARKLLPNSRFLMGLNTKVENRTNIYCFRALFDMLVPAKSTVLEDAEEVVVDVIGHNNLHALNGETYSKLNEILNK